MKCLCHHAHSTRLPPNINILSKTTRVGNFTWETQPGSWWTKQGEWVLLSISASQPSLGQGLPLHPCVWDAVTPVSSVRASCHRPCSSSAPQSPAIKELPLLSSLYLESSGKTDTDCVHRRISLYISLCACWVSGETDVVFSRHDFESHKHTYQQTAEHETAGNSQGHWQVTQQIKGD